jgi:adenylate cyclase
VLCVNTIKPLVRFTADDLQLLTATAHYAAIAVENCIVREDLRKHADLTERLFSSRFPPAIRKRVIDEAGSGTLVSAIRESTVTVLVADIRGFTELSARIGPRRMKDMLDHYFPALVTALHEYGGTVERFVGDAIFAVFGTPEPDDNQYEHAVKAALRMQAAVAVLSSLRGAAGQETCSIGIGIHSGTALHGFIGNAEHMEFAVLGTAANLANRYCSAAGPSQILLSADFYAHTFDKIDCDPVTIETKHEGQLRAYRLIGFRD